MIVQLCGGVGNQLFQYAFGRSVSLARNEDVFFEKYNLGDRHLRAYSLDAFNVNVLFANGTGLSEYREPSFCYDSGVYTAPHDSRFIGYWQTEKYFNTDIVRKEVTLRNPASGQTNQIMDAILRTENSTFLHVRRGDYTSGSTNAFHGMPTIDYYTKAMNVIRGQREGVKFFVFSDEPHWCRENFPTDCIVVDHNSNAPHEDLYLMSGCQHAILANSSFSWWGAWLGDQQTNRIVIAPKRWFAANIDTKDLIPERWVKL
jgi:hypothetical protein